MAEMKIGRRVYKVEPMLATDAIRLQMRIAKLIGGGIDHMSAILAGRGDKATPEQKAASDKAAIAAFTDIFIKADTEETVDLFKTIIETAMVKKPSGGYEQIDFDLDMTDSMGEVVPLGVFILRETFADFFSGAMGIGGQLKKVRKA